MNHKVLLVSMSLIAGLSVPASAANILSSFFRRDVQVVTDSDLFVSETPAASRQNPVPYLAVATGFRDFGGIVAGIKEPNQKEVLDAVTKTLASRGYQLATNKTPPKVIIAYGWGTLNANVLTFPDSPRQVLNRFQIIRFLGGKKMGIPIDANHAFPEYANGGLPVGLSMESLRVRDFYDMGDDDYYVIALTAYDLNEANNKKAKALWWTKISCRSIGHTMAEVLPTMLSIAAPHIGKQLAKPLIVDADDHYKPNIEIGTPRVVEEDVKESSH